MNDRTPKAGKPGLKIVKPELIEKFKSKNAPTISGVETLLTALPILKIGEVDDWTRLHPNEDGCWTPEMCFVSVPTKGTNKDMIHVIDDDFGGAISIGQEDQTASAGVGLQTARCVLLLHRAEPEPRQRLERRRAHCLPQSTGALGASGVAAVPRRGRLQDRVRPGPRGVSRADMAVTLARRIAGSHLRGGQHRSRSAPCPAAPDRRQANLT